MVQHYSDYIWNNGLPQGTKSTSENIFKQEIYYKIPSDPYHKRVVIEKYIENHFSDVIYDSALFDFRHLKQGDQLAWQKTPIHETHNTAICHIRNQDDRLILMEEYRFEKELCRECRAFSPLGVLVSIQKIFYVALNDPFNGVVLFDSNDHIVMSKHYEFDEETKTFSQLLSESWRLK